jgi:anti-sigma-K factor RskA
MSISDELLQRYHDGELTAEERASVEAQLDGDAKLRLEAIAELGGLLRGHSAYEAAQVDFSSTIEAIARAPQVVTAPQNDKRQSKLRRSLMPASAMSALAAGALALFFFMRPVVVHNDAHVESLEVTGSSPATVMQMPDANDPSHTTTVIWATLDDKDTDL